MAPWELSVSTPSPTPSVPRRLQAGSRRLKLKSNKKSTDMPPGLNSAAIPDLLNQSKAYCYGLQNVLCQNFKVTCDVFRLTS